MLRTLVVGIDNAKEWQQARFVDYWGIPLQLVHNALPVDVAGVENVSAVFRCSTTLGRSRPWVSERMASFMNRSLLK